MLLLLRYMLGRFSLLKLITVSSTEITGKGKSTSVSTNFPMEAFNFVDSILKNFCRVIPFFLELLKNEDEYALYHPLIIEALALVSDKGIKHKFCSETDEALVTQVLEDAGMMNVQTAVEATTKVSEVSEVLISPLCNCVLYTC